MSMLMPTRLTRATVLIAVVTPFGATAEEFRIMMLNAATNDAQHTNIFAPDILHIALGDTVTFIPPDTGQNTTV